MYRMKFGFCVLIALLAVPYTLAAQPPKSVDIRDLMSVTQFHQTGLDKLSPQELSALNTWLNQYLTDTGAAKRNTNPVMSPAPAASTTAVAAFGKEQIPQETAQKIESRVDGVLTGWTGTTEFKLENGQVWKQAGPGFEPNINLDHPQVVIKKLAFGYLLTLPGRSENVFVRRIK